MESVLLSADVEQRILEAARKEFEAKGYAGARMQAIADEAEISKASLHYYFRSKDGIFQRIFDEAFEEYVSIISKLTVETPDWETQIREFTGVLFDYIRCGRVLFLVREINRDPDLINKSLEKKKKSEQVAYFERLQATGKITHTDPRLLFIFLNSLCSFPVMNRVLFQKALRMSQKEYDQLMSNYARSVCDFFIQAIKK
ncbi:MAG: TetR/AcrR family transcriptional regulator [Bacteroidota bacterium]